MFGRNNEVCCHVVDSSTGIEYASKHDLMQAIRVKARDNIAKNVAIKELEKEVEDSKKQVSSLTKEIAELKKKNAAYRKELERMYLRAIGNCETVNQVKAVVKQYHESEIGKEDAWLTIKGFGSIGTARLWPVFASQTAVGQAAATKIRRLNHERIYDMCDYLDQETSEASYARHMMAVLKDVTGKEVDGTRILEAKKSGLDAMGVFKSILASYNVKQDEVM
jgi:regulator of replication initiation timing